MVSFPHWSHSILYLLTFSISRQTTVSRVDIACKGFSKPVRRKNSGRDRGEERVGGEDKEEEGEEEKIGKREGRIE